MSSGFKVTVFSLIAVFAVVVSQISVGMSSQTRTGAADKTTSTVAKGISTAPGKLGAGRASARGASAPGRSVAAAAKSVGTATKGAINTIQVSKVKGQTLLSAPKPGDMRKLGDLFELINTNDRQYKRARFQVFVSGNPPSSKSSDNFGLTKEWIEANKDLQVTLKMDDSGIIAQMTSMGAFPSDADLEKAKVCGWDIVFKYTIDNYKKILLYFTVPGFDQKFYLIDTWPQTTPIIYNANIAPEQACRAYRALMNWSVN